MLALGIVNEIERLLAARKLSERQIARKVGVSRGTVSAIAQGKRTDRVHVERQAAAYSTDAAPVRCPGCGATVYMPCLACHVRKLKRQQRILARYRAMQESGQLRRADVAAHDHTRSVSVASEHVGKARKSW